MAVMDQMKDILCASLQHVKILQIGQIHWRCADYNCNISRKQNKASEFHIHPKITYGEI